MLLWMARRSTAAGSWLDFWPFAGAARCTAFPPALTASCWLRETFGGLGGCTPAGSRRGARTLRCACSTSLDRWHYCTYRSSSERVSDCAWLHTTNSTRPPHEVSQSTAAVHAGAGTPQCRRRRLPVPHLSRAQTPAFLVYSTPQPKTCRQWGAFAPEQKGKSSQREKARRTSATQRAQLAAARGAVESTHEASQGGATQQPNMRRNCRCDARLKRETMSMRVSGERRHTRHGQQTGWRDKGCSSGQGAPRCRNAVHKQKQNQARAPSTGWKTGAVPQVLERAEGCKGHLFQQPMLAQQTLGKGRPGHAQRGAQSAGLCTKGLQPPLCK